MTLSTHVLDTARGRPAGRRRLARRRRRVTDDDGRVPGLLAGDLAAGTHRLTFATGEWFQAQGVAGFYPEVSVVCEIEDPGAHCHVPLLLSPYGYSTYRGS
jgi:5-hydroxyisourate hydrolase